MREATLRVDSRFCSSDPPGDEIKVSAYLDRQVVEIRNKTETTTATSRVPMKVALGETSMFVKGAYRRRKAERTEDHVTFVVELGLELIPSVFLFFLFRVTRSPFSI